MEEDRDVTTEVQTYHQAEDRYRLGLNTLYSVPDGGFFAHVATKYPRQWDSTLDAMGATDGRSILYNPEAVQDLSIQETTFLIAHEVAHIMLGHPHRRGGRDPETWNIACDIAVNQLVSRLGVTIEGSLTAASYGTEPGHNAEWYYDTLMKRRDGEPESDQEDEQQGGGQDEFQDDQDESQDDDTELTESPKAKEVQLLLPFKDSRDGGVYQTGDQDGDGYGRQGDQTIPGAGNDVLPPAQGADEPTASQSKAISTVVEALNAPRIGDSIGDSLRDALTSSLKPAEENWRSVLEDWMVDSAKIDRSYRRPNRRHLWRGMILPSRSGGSTLKHLWILLDESGSVDDHSIDQAFSAISDIAEQITGIEISILPWTGDAHPERISHYTDTDLPLKNVYQRTSGGTRVGPTLEWVREQSDVYGVIVISDMYIDDYPEERQPWPLLWLGYPSYYEGEHGVAPDHLGRTITIGGNQEDDRWKTR